MTAIKDAAGARGDIPTRTTAKLMINSVYGKFASKYFLSITELVDSTMLETLQNTFDIESVCEITDNIFLATRRLEVSRNADKRAEPDFLKRSYNKAHTTITDKNTNVALAAAITSRARLVMLNLFEEVGKMGGVILYTDTDSVYASLPTSPFGKPFGPFI